MTKDVTEKLHNSIIQHGKMSDRIYLMYIDKSDYKNICSLLDTKAKEHGYSKIIAKIPSILKSEFEFNGYKNEANIKNYYNMEDECFFMGKFFNSKNEIPDNQNIIEKIIKTSLSKTKITKLPNLPDNVKIRKLEEKDSLALANLYKKTFATYPFPIYEQNYIKETMLNNVSYYGLLEDDKLIAAASSELNSKYHNAEMTDFAVNSIHRGKNYALYLLTEMENELKQQDYKTLYTIARAVSYGMNITFAKLNYIYSGTLVNNTNISGKIETMNVWYKAL